MRKTTRYFGLILLLLVAVFLTGTLAIRLLPGAPIRLAEVMAFRETAGPWILRGSMSPRDPEGVAIEVGIRDANGTVPPEGFTVDLILSMLDHQMEPVGAQMIRTGPGSYRGELSLPMAGQWQLTIRLPTSIVRLNLQAQGVPPSDLRIEWVRRVARLLRRGQPEPYGGSIRDNPSPIPPTPQSLAIGQRIYREQCEVCHGVVGSGDGPGAAALDPRPADLRIHMAAGHTDGEFFFWISEGFKGTAMPAFKGRLSDEDRWHVLNFIKTLALTDR